MALVQQQAWSVHNGWAPACAGMTRTSGERPPGVRSDALLGTLRHCAEQRIVRRHKQRALHPEHSAGPQRRRPSPDPDYMPDAFVVSTEPMVVKAVPIAVPSEVTPLTISAPMTAAIRPYSNAVTPRVSRFIWNHANAILNMSYNPFFVARWPVTAWRMGLTGLWQRPSDNL
jgi:hypothetical protein